MAQEQDQIRMGFAHPNNEDLILPANREGIVTIEVPKLSERDGRPISKGYCDIDGYRYTCLVYSPNGGQEFWLRKLQPGEQIRVHRLKANPLERYYGELTAIAEKLELQDPALMFAISRRMDPAQPVLSLVPSSGERPIRHLEPVPTTLVAILDEDKPKLPAARRSKYSVTFPEWMEIALKTHALSGEKMPETLRRVVTEWLHYREQLGPA